MRLRNALGLLLLLLVPSAAHAEWLQASSDHFVVYAADSERDIRRFSDRLERYHAALAYIFKGRLDTPSPSNRVTVYVVSNAAEVRRLYGENSKFIGGFYIPRAGGSLAIVPRVSETGDDSDFATVSLLHEYAHHFLIASSSFAMPRWLSEGGAEFSASASFKSDGSVEIGKPAMHRAAELLIPGFARDVSVADLIDPTNYEKRNYKGYDAFYGKSWLLYHYLSFEPTRAGQLDRYGHLLLQGRSSREAGQQAFGDFAVLEKELDRYLQKNRMLMLKLPANLLKTGAVTIRRLSPGEAAMMPIRIRSSRGVDEAGAKAVLADARKVAAQYGDDPAVQVALAEAEHDGGNDALAIAAADAALAKDPTQVNAYVQKGLSLLRLAEKAKPEDQPAAYKRARSAFLALNRLENDHPLPLIFNYKIFTEQGLEPPPLALAGLERAMELAPFDLGLRMNLAMQELRFGKRDLARRNLAPVAYNPHGGGLAKAAQEALAKMESDPKWNGSGLVASPDIDVGNGQGS